MYIESKQFLPGLHVLRGLAATATVFFHLLNMQPVFEVHYLKIVNTFGAGVTLFFMLSCFSLIHSTTPKLGHSNWLSGYFIRRFFRIYPLFVAMIFVHLIFQYLNYGKVNSLGEILLNVSLLYQFIPGHHSSIVWAGWTIGVEVVFYCLFPLMLVLSRKLWVWVLLLLFAALLSREIPGVVKSLNLISSYGYMSFPRQLVFFILGGVIYFIAAKYSKIKKTRIAALIIFFSLALFIILHQYGFIHARIGKDFLFIKAIALAALIYFFFDKDIFFNKFTKFLGESSYTIYLAHPIVIGLSKPWLKHIYDYGLPPDVAFMIAFMVVFLIVCLISYVINNFYEIPIYRFGVKIAKRKETMAI